jgi:hypothetical protein
MFRKIIRDAIAAAQRGDRLKGMVPKGREEEIVYFDSFTGVRKSGR